MRPSGRLPLTPSERNSQASAARGNQPGLRGRSAIQELDLEQRRAFQKREPRALEAFFDAYFPAIYTYVMRSVGDSHVAEDLTQEIFLKIHRAQERLEPERLMRPWVFTIASNTIRDWAKRHALRAVHDRDLEGGALDEYPASSDEAPQVCAEMQEVKRTIEQALASLEHSLRGAVLLRHSEQLSFAEIGRCLGLTEDAARQRHARGIQRLRELLSIRGFKREGLA